MAEVEKPAPDADEVLVKVLATSVNPADWHSMRGKPLFSRATLGLLRPKHRILGVDIAGQVEAVGSGVTRFKPGDEVYANLLDHGYGGLAEYVSVPVHVMSLKPANLSFEEAAAVPMAAVTAPRGLRHHGEIQPGQRVLINGASGGVGTFAVQIAKSYGPEMSRSSAGRAGFEAMWVPTALLPRFGVTWTATDPHHITATYSLDDIEIELHHTLDDDGRVRSIAMERWADPHSTGTWGFCPFGGDVTRYATFDGVTIPSAGRAGWLYGTDRWKDGEFFRYEIIHFHLVM
jgi:hypothetical protein